MAAAARPDDRLDETPFDRTGWRADGWFLINANGDRATELMIQRRFEDYRFFEIQSEEIMRSLQENAVPTETVDPGP